MSDDPREPELETVLSVFGESLLYGVRVSMPGRIASYDADTQIASVQPLIMDSYIDDAEQRIAQALPEIHDVPVFFLGSARGRITYPVATGDLCLIVWSSSSIARWVRSSGGIVDPGDDRRHDLNDAIAIVGLHTAARVPTTAPVDAMVLHAGDGVTVKIGGASDTQPTLMANSFLAALDLVHAAFAAALAVVPGAEELVGPALEAFQKARVGYKTSKAQVK